MNDATLYDTSNELQRQDSKKVLNDYIHLFKWRNDGTDSLLDIGCGAGDVTIDFILPILPGNFARLVGCDISEEMVRYARQKYCKKINSKTEFTVMNIEREVQENCYNKYEHITSFFCLHWVQNQKQALKNIYNLLTNDGDALLVFLVANPIFYTFNEMSKTYKWGPYLSKIIQTAYISPYQFSTNPYQEFEDVMLEAGFTNFHIELRDSQYVFSGIEQLKNSVEAVNPFLDDVPKQLHNDFMNDYLECAEKLKILYKWPAEDPNGNEPRLVSTYKLLIAFARK